VRRVHSTAALQRRLGLGDAVALGLASMIGAGVFSAFAPAAAVAGPSLLVGLALAALVAFCNATSSAQLAAQTPTSGGTYVFGRVHLGPWWGYIAGWSFVVGKSASCVAMATTFAAYAAPPGWERPVAVLAIAALAVVNCFGVTRTALLARILVTASLLTLAIVVASGIFTLAGAAGTPAQAAPAGDDPFFAGGWYGVLQSGGLLFFAFAGYARIATMGEEVRDPRRNIPRAIVLALSLVVVVYALVGAVVLLVLGPSGTAATAQPLALVVQEAGWGWAAPLVRVGAAAASLGALLSLITGTGRTTLAMAREGDLPRWLAVVDRRFGVPQRAELSLAAIMCIAAALVDLRGAIAFSSFGVLLYYFVANAAALRQRAPWRRYPRALAVVGAVLCVVLVATLPWQGVAAGAAVVVAGVLLRLVVRSRTGATPS